VHLLFDFLEVLLSKRFIAQEFVEKAGVDRRADAEFYIGIQLHDCRGEQVGRGMTEHKESVRIFFGEDLQLDVVVKRAPQIN